MTFVSPDLPHMFGQCPYCKGNLTNGHSCRQMVEAMKTISRDDPPKLAQMIRLWIAANGVEQTALAVAWGCSTSTVSRFLSGPSLPDARTTARIIAWLFDSAGAEPSHER